MPAVSSELRDPSAKELLDPDEWRCQFCGESQPPRRRCVVCGKRFQEPEVAAAEPPSYWLPGERRLPRVDADPQARLHFLGVHGGAGESTVARLIPESVEAHGAWPVEPVAVGEPAKATPVILVARTHADGLAAARSALNEWSSGQVAPVDVRGLVLVADVPGRPPAPIRRAMAELKSVAPGYVSLPYLRQLRVEAASTTDPTRPEFSTFRNQILAMLGGEQ